MSADQLRRALVRISHEILEQNERPVAIVGLHSRGVELARRIADLITSIEGVEGQQCVRPAAGGGPGFGTCPCSATAIAAKLSTDCALIRAALDAIRDFGRPSSIQLAVLVDRGHRELPIRADYVGKNVPTARGEEVRVMLEEVDGTDGVTLLRQSEATAYSGGQG